MSYTGYIFYRNLLTLSRKDVERLGGVARQASAGHVLVEGNSGTRRLVCRRLL